jgi:hypothetical protein
MIPLSRVREREEKRFFVPHPACVGVGRLASRKQGEG